MNDKTMAAALKLVEKGLNNAAEKWAALPYQDKNGKQKPALRDYLYQHFGGAVGQNSKYVVCCCHDSRRPGSTKLSVEVMGKSVTYYVWLQDLPKDTTLKTTKDAGPSSKHYGVEPSNCDVVSYLNDELKQRRHAAAERRSRRWEDQDW